jgi:hypothetical protein
VPGQERRKKFDGVWSAAEAKYRRKFPPKLRAGFEKDYAIVGDPDVEAKDLADGIADFMAKERLLAPGRGNRRRAVKKSHPRRDWRPQTSWRMMALANIVTGEKAVWPRHAEMWNQRFPEGPLTPATLKRERRRAKAWLMERIAQPFISCLEKVGPPGKPPWTDLPHPERDPHWERETVHRKQTPPTDSMSFLNYSESGSEVTRRMDVDTTEGVSKTGLQVVLPPRYVGPFRTARLTFQCAGGAGKLGLANCEVECAPTDEGPWLAHDLADTGIPALAAGASAVYHLNKTTPWLRVRAQGASGEGETFLTVYLDAPG